MGTQTISANVVESMPVTMATMIEEKPSFTPTEPAKKIPTTLKQVGQRRDYQMIDPRTIDIEPGFNARDFTKPENIAHFNRLKAMIIESGRVEKPISVRLNKDTGRATVVDGETRLRIVWQLIAEGRHPFVDADMPCFPAPPGSDDPIVRRFASLSANEGKSLSKWELGKGYQDLYDLNVSVETIAKRTANSVSFVKEAMELASAPEEVKQLLSEKAITTAEVVRQLRANPESAAHTISAKVQANRAAGNKGPVKRDKAKAKDSHILPSALVKTIMTLVEDVPAEDMNDTDMDAPVVVKLGRLLALLSFAVTEDDLKAVGVETANF